MPARWRRPARAARACWSASAPSLSVARTRSRVLARRGRPRQRPLPPGVAGDRARRASPPPTARRPPAPRPWLMPRCCAHATPATVTVPGRPLGAVARGVDPRLGLDRPLRRPAARHPVGVEVGEPGQLDLGDPLAGGHVAVQAGHDHPHREAVLHRQRLAVHPDREQRVPPVAQHRGRACRRSSRPTERCTTWSAPGSGSRLVEQLLDRRAQPAARCRSGRRRPRWTRRPASRTARSSAAAAAAPR